MNDKPPLERINIEEKAPQVEALRTQIGAVEFFSDRHKKLREWQVLCAAHALSKQAQEPLPGFAIEGETPDFALFDREASAGFAEIVEAVRPDYRRHDFHKEDAKMTEPFRRYEVDSPLADPWASLRSQILKKAKKEYPSSTILIVYYDLPRSTFRAFDTPFDELLLAEHAAYPFAGVESFLRVLVLNCDLKSLIELSPRARTIVADSPFC